MNKPTPFAGPVIAEFQKNARERLRIRFTEYNDYKLVDMRVWYEDESSGKLLPGKGITLRRELLPELRAAIEAAERAAADPSA